MVASVYDYAVVGFGRRGDPDPRAQCCRDRTEKRIDSKSACRFSYPASHPMLIYRAFEGSGEANRNVKPMAPVGT